MAVVVLPGLLLCMYRHTPLAADLRLAVALQAVLQGQMLRSALSPAFTFSEFAAARCRLVCLFLAAPPPRAAPPPPREGAVRAPCPFHPRRGSGTASDQRSWSEDRARRTAAASAPSLERCPGSPLGPGAGRAPGGGGRRSARSRGPGSPAPSALRHGCGGRRRLPAPVPARPGAARRQRAAHQGLRAPRRHHLLQGTARPAGATGSGRALGTGEGGGGGGVGRQAAGRPGARRPCAPPRMPQQ